MGLPPPPSASGAVFFCRRAPDRVARESASTEFEQAPYNNSHYSVERDVRDDGMFHFPAWCQAATSRELRGCHRGPIAAWMATRADAWQLWWLMAALCAT